MLVIYAPARQQSFFDGYLDRALADDPLLSKVDAFLATVPDILDPFIDRYTNDRVARGIDSADGRPTIALENIVRLLILRTLYKHSTFRDLEQRVKTDYAAKAFARLHVNDPVPDYTTLHEWEQFFGEETLRAVHDRIITALTGKGIITGKRFRIDTTVVPANIRYPTDANLLGDMVRVITKTVTKIKNNTKITLRFRDRTRTVKKVLRQLYLTRINRTEPARAAARKATKRILTILKTVERDAAAARTALARQRNRATAAARRTLRRQLADALALAALLREQTQCVLAGGKPTDRIVSVHQTSMRPIVKGKQGVACEFGNKFEIIEAERGIVTDWKGHAGNPNDTTLLIPALDRHKQRFGRDPTLVATDRGFYSADNEEKVKKRGTYAAIPKRGYKDKRRLRRERSKRFRSAQNWRAGGEAKISELKRVHGASRSRARTEQGYSRSIGWGIIGCNLKTIAAFS